MKLSIANLLEIKLKRKQASYMMVTMLAMLESCSTEGVADIDDVTAEFSKFYKQRIENRKLAEAKDKGMADPFHISFHQVKSLLLKNPIPALHDYIDYDRHDGLLKFKANIASELMQETVRREVRKIIYQNLYEYYSSLDTLQITLKDLNKLPLEYAVSAKDIAQLSKINQVKGIHPIENDEVKAVVILCTIGGESYNNQWLNEKQDLLKYYLEGRTDSQTGQKTYNLNLRSNKTIIESKENGYPILVFTRETKGKLFHFSGEFSLLEVVQEESGDYYFKLKQVEKGANSMAMPNELNLSSQEVLQRIHQYIKNKGFSFDLEMLQNFHLSVKTKPFVILAGVSGTGKSKLVELFAEAIGATNENGRYNLIPVRPDWNDSTDLLGYANLHGEFIPGKLTQVIMRAEQDLDNPYFICLDEMNLARVEYYFSDFLSTIESRKKNPFGKTVSTSVKVHGLDEEISFPENLYIIGTVNMDETTHPFSKKVLDRANTIEFSTINLNMFPDISVKEAEGMNLTNEFFKSDYLTLKDCYFDNEGYIVEKVKILEEINKVLEPAGLQIGYRVRDEFCFYLIYNKINKLMSDEKAIDYQIMQKILPRIQGSGKIIEDTLDNLAPLLETYPLSKAKLSFIKGRFQDENFTSFWI